MLNHLTKETKLSKQMKTDHVDVFIQFIEKHDINEALNVTKHASTPKTSYIIQYININENKI